MTLDVLVANNKTRVLPEENFSLVVIPQLRGPMGIREWVSTNVWRENKIQHELVFGQTKPACLQCGRNSNFCQSKG